MKCMSCEAIIDPKWRHSITANVCPFCGKDIMSEHLKNLLSSLCDVMDGLKDYPEQIDDYMLSNYNYIKTDSPYLNRYIVKSSKIEDKDKVKLSPSEKKQEESVKDQTDIKTNEFFKRADLIKPNIDGFNSMSEKNQHLKKMLKQIKESGTTVINEDGQESVIDPEMLVPEEIDSSQEIRSAISTERDDEIPAAVLAMAANKTNSNSNSADLIKLQQLRSKVQQSRENFESGANRGKGGFSRV